MAGYEVSESTVFVSGDNVTHGWKTVLEHYKKSYDTREKMGELTFSDLESRCSIKTLRLSSVAGFSSAVKMNPTAVSH